MGIFTDHPASVGETYGQHFRMASSFGTRMMVGGVACLIHGFLPFLFLKTGSKTVDVLHGEMVTNRRRQGLVPPPAEAERKWSDADWVSP